MSDTKWVRSSLRHLGQELAHLKHEACPMTVKRLLEKLGYSLKTNVKRLTGPAHPERDCQFKQIEVLKKVFLQAGWPVISVDAKKKELIGNFKNAGRTWCRAAEAVNEHDFLQDGLGKAVPYGIYDLIHNRGFVGVGNSLDTSQFAVDVIALWWKIEGRSLYPDATKILILADAGGSNSYRYRLWKQQLQVQLADRLGLEVTICHYPTGASKWNPVEHRLFGPISINWASKPLCTFETMLAYIRGTTTKTGLEVKALLLDQQYQKGVKISDKEMHSLNLERHHICPQWNYTIKPRSLVLVPP